MKESIKYLFINAVGDNSVRGSIIVKYGNACIDTITQHQWIFVLGNCNIATRSEMIEKQCKELGITDYLIAYYESTKSSNQDFFYNKTK